MRDTRTLRNRPVDRLWNAVLGTGTDWDTFAFTEDHVREIRDSGELPKMIAALRDAEATVRRLRYRLEELSAGGETRKCWACGAEVVGRSDRVYCSPRCRQRGHRGTDLP